MTALDIIQILVFAFAAVVFTFSAVTTRKRKKLEREIARRTHYRSDGPVVINPDVHERIDVRD